MERDGCLTPTRRTVDLYVSADVETDGPIPGPYSMLSFGIAVAGSFDGQTFRRPEKRETFYRELRPISESWDAKALEVSGLDRARLQGAGLPAHLLPDLPHTHNALDDALEQAEIFARVFEWEGL